MARNQPKLQKKSIAKYLLLDKRFSRNPFIFTASLKEKICVVSQKIMKNQDMMIPIHKNCKYLTVSPLFNTYEYNTLFPFNSPFKYFPLSSVEKDKMMPKMKFSSKSHLFKYNPQHFV